MRFSSRTLIRAVPLVVVVVLAGLQLLRKPAGTTSVTIPPSAEANSSNANAGLKSAARAHASGVEVEAHGRVTRILPDDTKGSRHQRFLVQVAGGLTILVAHNLNLAPRIPVQRGDSLDLRGEYVWNERGGMMHWTHRDPARRHEAGWIDYRGRRYN